jgi:hypothetical protein
MSLNNYDVIAINPLTGRTAAYLTAEQMVELRFSVKVNDIGALAITLEKNIDTFWEIFSIPDMLLDVRRNGVVEATYLLTMRQLGAEGNQEFMVIGGMSLEQLISRRITDPTDDSIQPNGGFITKAGATDTILRALLREQLGDLASVARQMPGIVIADVAGTGTPRGLRTRYDELSQTILNVLRSSNIDVEVVRTNGSTIEFRLAPRGTDRTYSSNFPNPFTALSPERGNLANPSYVEDWSDAITFIYVGGKGEGANRQILKLPNTSGINESPYGRREYFTDARESITVSDLLTVASSELNTRAKQTKFDFDIIGERGGSTYRIDYFLGDTITVYWKNFIQNVRVNSVEFNIKASGETLEVEVDNIL